MAWRIGVDIGGTFTDVALIDEAHGAIGVAKTPTTPEDFGRGVLNGLNDALAKYSIPPAEVTLLSHATTVVTNALLEEKGARIAHVSTRGFRDVLELRRSARANSTESDLSTRSTSGLSCRTSTRLLNVSPSDASATLPFSEE